MNFFLICIPFIPENEQRHNYSCGITCEYESETNIEVNVDIATTAFRPGKYINMNPSCNYYSNIYEKKKEKNKPRLNI